VYAFFWQIPQNFKQARESAQEERQQSHFARQFSEQFDAIPAELHIPIASILDNDVVLAANFSHSHWVRGPWEKERHALRANVDTDTLPHEFAVWQGKIIRIDWGASYSYSPANYQVHEQQFSYSRIHSFQILCISDDNRAMADRLKNCRDNHNFVLVAKPEKEHPAGSWGLARLAPPHRDERLLRCWPFTHPELLERLKGFLPEISPGTQRLTSCPGISWSLEPGTGSLIGLYDPATETLAFWWKDNIWWPTGAGHEPDFNIEKLLHKVTWKGVTAVPTDLGLGFEEDALWLIEHETDSRSITDHSLRIQSVTSHGDIRKVYEFVSSPEALQSR
ncbi:MAG: hypothetical protein KIT18_08760, partial [Burkholderiales bacterium]|nr:hypothetical protein [Burkholderiales bacterium]